MTYLFSLLDKPLALMTLLDVFTLFGAAVLAFFLLIAVLREFVG